MSISVRIIEHDGTEFELTTDEGVSLMEVAIANNVPGIVAECGGNLACATCHCYVDAQWLDKLPEPSEDEVLMLEGTMSMRPESRLSCQISIGPELQGLLVRLPESQY